MESERVSESGSLVSQVNYFQVVKILYLLLYDSVYSVGSKVRFSVNTPERLFVSSAVKYQS